MLAQLFDDVQVLFPKYLSPKDHKELYSELEKFPDKLNYYFRHDSDNVLQGDGWRGFVVIDFETLARKTISAAVISNSCDIDSANQADSPRKILFAPIIALSTLRTNLHGTGQQVADKIDAIRRQRITTMFYLPELPGVMGESVALLDDIHQEPLGRFLAAPPNKLFTLSQAAFWIFLIKLSIHFMRLNEGVKRI